MELPLYLVFVDIFACTPTEPIFVPVRARCPYLRYLADGQLYTVDYEAFSLNRE
jgi:hypothetical protein